ncbi:hypothetical protein EX895_000641 [Sporisorium graminicola]|uniref:Ubiquitin-like protease family profile domain-containing protein n=1 Tax=Sporisorium graminicola TaxID=280036 RepID=A0A4U7L0J9_9BASI|nr:hypothetical protein EX895_000641 [Sporisorium graminicola]TKY90643.1 hypothetical protein EX895_000641 [Sporisorium graminicola]
MVRNLSTEEYKTVKEFHGIPQRTATPIDVPQNGDTPGGRSSSYGRSRRNKPDFPSHPATFLDNLHSEGDHVVRPFTVNGTAKRTGHRSASLRTPSADSQARSPLASSPNAVLADLATSSKFAKGKAKAQDVSPRTTRSRTLRKASAQAEFINLASDEDDDDEHPHVVPQISSSSRASKCPPKEPVRSAALQAKDVRRKHEDQAVSKSSSAAPPSSFYSRAEPSFPRPANRPNPLFGNGRPEGPIQLEEPVPRRASGSTHVVHLRDSPEPESGVKVPPPHRLDRASSSQPRPKLSERMKPKARSPIRSDLAERSSKILPSGSQTRSPQSRSHLELNLSPSEHDTNGSTKGRKRSRTDDGRSLSHEKRFPDWPVDFPFEVRLRAIIVSDAWKSRENDRMVMVLNQHHLFFGLSTGQAIKVRYSDIREIVASKLDVKQNSTLCLTLAPNSESARNVQAVFSEYDPRASGDAAQIQLVALDFDEVERLNHNRAIAWITHKLREPRPDGVKVFWLDEYSAKGKISSVERVMQLPWPEASTTPVQTRPKRTLIVPGADRFPNNDLRQFTRQTTTYIPSEGRTKTFNIQPDSPNSPANSSVDVDMADAFSRSKLPTLAPLSTPKPKPASTSAAKVEVRRPRVSSDGTILHYPYEGIGAMSLRDADFDKLLDGGLLNDSVIEFGMKFILDEIRANDPELADSIHVFNTFFSTILMSDSVENSYAKVRRWTARDDIFSKKYIVIPVNENYHWYLALIVNPGYILADNGKDSSSEQDTEEVAQALTLPSKDSSRPPCSPRATATSENKEGAPEPRQAATAAGSSDPETPPLPPLHLPLQSYESSSASLPTPMEVDTDSRSDSSTKSPASGTTSDQLIIITLDSLGQRHVKLANKLFEYLWREAWDKKISTIARSPKRPVDDKGKQDGRAREDACENADVQTSASDKEPAKDQAAKTSKDAHDDSTEEPDVLTDGIRSVKVQDSRRSATCAATKSTEAEAWAKSLSKAVYINAQVPEQPNFCDCGIYLLHYIDRFFRQPDKLLELTVKARDRLASVNKAGSSARHQAKRDIERKVEAEWQAGEVGTKRAYWRSKLVELSEGWEAFKKQKEENAVKSEQEETKPDKDEEEPELGSSQQKQAPSPAKDGDIPMPDADPDRGVNEEHLPSVEHSKEASGEKAVNTLDDIERSVDDCVRATDPAASRVVDDILVQAMATQQGPLSQEQLRELQMEDREQAHQLRPASEWRHNVSDIGAFSTAVPPVGNSGSSAVPVGVVTEAPPKACVLGQREQKEQDTPSPFGASIMPTASGTSSDPAPSLSFASSKHAASEAVRGDFEDWSIDEGVGKLSSELALESVSVSSSSDDNM